MDVAVMGTGLMGRPIAERLLERGYRVTVFNRTKEKAQPLKAAGARVAGTPEEAIEAGPCIILMLTDGPAVRQVLRRSMDQGLLHGRTVIQMGTIGPRESEDLCRDVEKAGGQYLEAPVLRSKTEARAGTLTIMVGGDQALFETWKPVLDSLGTEPRLIGPVGKAAALKLALNQLIASLTTAFGLSLGLIEREGISIETFMEILRDSPLYAPTFDKKLPRMQERDFTNPNFPGVHLLKDVELFLEEAGRLGLTTVSLEGVRQVLTQTISQGWGQDDYSALFNGISPPNRRS